MQVLKNFNNISKELLESVPKLQHGEVKTIQMLTGTKLLQVMEDGSQYWEEVFGKHQIPTSDRIKDPFFKRGVSTTPEYVQIGVPAEINPNTEAVVSTKPLIPGIGESQFLGKFSLVGGDVEDEEMYEYLWLSNLNGSNPNRDKSIAPLYEFIDVKKASKEKRRNANDKLTALSVATAMDLDDIKDFHLSMGWNLIDDPDILRANIEDYADKFCEEFIARFNDPLTKVKSEIKRAVDNGILKYDPTAHKILYAKSNTVVAKLERVEGQNWLDQAAEWTVVSGVQGTNFRKAIQKQLKDLLTKDKEELVSE